MYLVLMDDEIGKPVAGRVQVDYDYQAEQFVYDLATERKPHHCSRPLITFILVDELGIRCVWTRSVEEAMNKMTPELLRVATRFDGLWQHNVTPVQELTPQDNYERLALQHVSI